jgi:hypothetical protein
MRGTLKLFVLELFVVAIAVGVISACYILVAPKFLNDQRTYSILTCGLVFAAFVGGFIAHRNLERGRPYKYLVTVSIGAAVLFGTLLFSLFLILNIRGS